MVNYIHLGNNIYEGNTADTKPTNVPAGSIAIDKQTPTMYVYSGSVWVQITSSTSGGITASSTDTLTNKNLTDATNTFRAWVNADISASAAIALTKLSSSGAATNNVITYNGTSIVWAAPTGGGGGEANTASNQGVGGVGPFYQKSGVDLQFKNVNAGSNKITVTDDTTNHEIDIDVAVANITGLVDANLGTFATSKISINNKSQLNANIVYNDQTNTFGAFDQIFKSGNIKVRNPADTFSFILTGTAITADRILNLPLITGTDTLMALGLDQAISQPKRYATSTLRVQNLAQNFTYIFTSSAITASRNINLPLLGADDVFVFQDFIQTLTNKTFTAPVQSSYEDFTRTTLPSNPSANFGRMYVKQVDTNNDGLFILLKKAGSYVEIQIQ